MKHGSAIMSDRTRIAWTLEGDEASPVLLLSNSLGTDRSMWDAQAAAFSNHFRVLRYDTRGHGESEAPHGAYGLDRLGRDVVELLDSLEIAKANFCGVSLGGMTGQWLGIHAGDRIDRLVLANTSACMGPPSSWQDRIETVTEQGMAALANAIIGRWFTPGFIEEWPPALAKLKENLLGCSPKGYAGCCAAIRDMDMRPVIRLIDVPTLVVTGLRDPATPPADGQAIAATISGSQLVALDASHLSNIELPEEFNAAVLEFLCG